MNRIKELRKEKGLSIDKLSEELKNNGYSISAASISKYEREQRKPKIQSWEAMAGFFNVSVPYLQGISNSKGKPSKDKTIADVISIIHEALIYLGRHAVTGNLPKSRLNGLALNRIDDIYLQDILMYLINLIGDDDDYFDKYDNFVAQLSKQVVNYFEKKDDISNKATNEDVSNVIELYYQLVKSQLSDRISNDNVIDHTIANIQGYVIDQLNFLIFDQQERHVHYKRDDSWNIEKIINIPLDKNLPKNVDKETYRNILEILNESVNKILALRSEKLSHIQDI